jgi:hypothetical protein
MRGDMLRLYERRESCLVKRSDFLDTFWGFEGLAFGYTLGIEWWVGHCVSLSACK